MTRIFVLVIIGLALLGAPIFAAMTVLSALGATVLPTHPQADLVERFGVFVMQFVGLLTRVQSLSTGDTATTLSTIPLFTFAGYVMAKAKTADRLVGAAKALVGWIPGGLALVTILACALFTTFTGASGVTIVAVGGLIFPSLIKEGYRERFSLGLVTGTGSIGLLFPPALPLIVYGIVYGVSTQGAAANVQQLEVEKFLFAGIVPGFVLIAAVSIYAITVAIRDRVPRAAFEPGIAAREIRRGLPELVIPVLILLTLTQGWLQVPEAAALTALYVLIIETFYYRDVRLRDLPKVAREAMAMVGAIFIIIVAATALTDYFVNATVPDKLYEWMDQYIDSKFSFLLALNVLLLIVGCLMDIFSAIVVVVPLIIPAAAHYHIDPYHLGVIFLLNLEIGYLTPPVGLNLFITSFRFKKPMAEVYKAAIPFILVMLGALALVTYIPALTPIQAPATAAGAASEPSAAEADAVDAGMVEIHHPDGAVWIEASRCGPLKAEGGEDYLYCQTLFADWARCQKLEEALDKVECEQMTLEGDDFFAQDAGAD